MHPTSTVNIFAPLKNATNQYNQYITVNTFAPLKNAPNQYC